MAITYEATKAQRTRRTTRRLFFIQIQSRYDRAHENSPPQRTRRTQRPRPLRVNRENSESQRDVFIRDSASSASSVVASFFVPFRVFRFVSYVLFSRLFCE